MRRAYRRRDIRPRGRYGVPTVAGAPRVSAPGDLRQGEFTGWRERSILKMLIWRRFGGLLRGRRVLEMGCGVRALPVVDREGHDFGTLGAGRSLG